MASQAVAAVAAAAVAGRQQLQQRRMRLRRQLRRMRLRRCQQRRRRRHWPAGAGPSWGWPFWGWPPHLAQLRWRRQDTPLPPATAAACSQRCRRQCPVPPAEVLAAAAAAAAAAASPSAWWRGPSAPAAGRPAGSASSAGRQVGNAHRQADRQAGCRQRHRIKRSRDGSGRASRHHGITASTISPLASRSSRPPRAAQINRSVTTVLQRSLDSLAQLTFSCVVTRWHSLCLPPYSPCAAHE